MVFVGDRVCPYCDGELHYYDTVTRFVIGPNRIRRQIKISRLRCIKCGKVHRCLPHSIYPYIQYRSDIVLESVQSDRDARAIEYEDYPCDTTVYRWNARKSQFLLWNKT